MNDTNKKDDLDAVRDVVKALEAFNEEEQQRIIRWAAEKLGIANPIEHLTSQTLPASTSDMHEVTETKRPVASVKNIKTFVEEKNPKTDIHFAAVVAYYYQFECPETEKKESISACDLTGATRLVNRNRLARPDQTLVNAMNAGLLDKAAYGQYTLNSVGENLVAMILPDSTSQKTTVPKKRKVQTKKTKSVAKKPKK